MTSFRQIEANPRNAQLSTGPVTEEGKRICPAECRSSWADRKTVVDALEDGEDYAALRLRSPPTTMHNPLSEENSY